MNTFENIFAKKKNILVVMAHPDDVIVYYGALINKLVNNQINVYV